MQYQQYLNQCVLHNMKVSIPIIDPVLTLLFLFSFFYNVDRFALPPPSLTQLM
jgi:hypothetical protein